MNIRIDDLSSNTDLVGLRKILNEIVTCQQITEVMIGVNLMSKTTIEGSVYPAPPFKNKDVGFFYDVDRLLNTSYLDTLGFVKIASHGLIHFDHSKMGRQAQEMSIITSCKALNTSFFIPPFNNYDTTTQDICRRNNIQLIKGDWRSLDYEVLVNDKFDHNHDLWYMHPWRWTPGKFREKITGPLNRLVSANPQPAN